jgi:hypothetical protein
LLERIEAESIWLFCPELADELIGREAFERLQSLGEVVGRDEVCEMGSQFVMGVVVEALYSYVLDEFAPNFYPVVTRVWRLNSSV